MKAPLTYRCWNSSLGGPSFGRFAFNVGMICGLALLISGCIKPYTADFKKSSVSKYVVQGMVSSEPGWQEVEVSVSAPMNKVQFIPVDGCQLEILDDQNHKFTLNGYGEGKYRVWMDQEYLVPGRGYKVRVETPQGILLESTYDYMTTGPEVKDVFFRIEDKPTNVPGEVLQGIQFYSNLEGTWNQSRYYRWKLTETWEYHAAYPREFYYDGEIQEVSPPDYSQIVCYNTRSIDEIFTLNTQNFTENAVEDFPLHYVKNTSSRLAIMYSLLIQQMALSQDAYIYWDQLRQNTNEPGGLYSTQPLAIRGNLMNISQPDEEVLGFFQASKLSTLRLFVEPIPELELYFSDRCNPETLMFGFLELSPRDYPAYLLTIDGVPQRVLLNDECVFCTLQGGVTEKPDYWPIK